MPTEPLRPRPDSDRLKFDAGSWPRPRLWNGPPKPKLIGVVRLLEPDGVSEIENCRRPLFTACLPLKVWLSSDLASPELLDEPHAVMASATASRAKAASAS